MPTKPILILAAASPTLAQVDGTATWLWEVTTESGDAVVEPGETATVTLSVDMDPDPHNPRGPVLSFYYAEFNTLGGAHAAHGSIIDWEIHGLLGSYIEDQTTTDGVSLLGTVVGQPYGANFDDADPIDVLSFTWSPNTQGAYQVEYATETAILLVLEVTGPNFWDPFEWDVVEADVTFDVIPTPTCLLALLTPLIARRRH